MTNNILIAVTGSISAYKIADVVSELTKRGHQVQCVLTASAQQFITPLVLETLSGRPVKSDLFGADISGTEHIDLARWADIVVIAPATANVLAKLALGLAAA
ncbi:flavoprotein, partial [Devosia sp.]|uniref:flavoprotein n=1 Tax=Devosia sp. TaxID=1871048 RepID=UPI002FC9B709